MFGMSEENIMIYQFRSFSTQSYEANLEHCDITDQIEEHIKGHGIMSGWTWSASQAHYKGYWMDNDIENPFCVQVSVASIIIAFQGALRSKYVCRNHCFTADKLLPSHGVV